METLIQLRTKLEAKNKVLADVFKQAGETVDIAKVESPLFEGCNSTQDRTQKMREANAEICVIGKQVSECVELEKMAQSTADNEKLLSQAVSGVIHPVGSDGAAQGMKGNIVVPKSLGKLFIESKAYTGRKEGAAIAQTFYEDDEMDLKTLFETTAGFAPESVRSGLILPAATRPIQIIDRVPSGAINQAAEVYMEQTTRTNTAAETAEGGTFNEATFVYTERSETVRKITISLPVTDEQLEDEARISSIITDDLMLMLRQRLDSQLLVGNGVAPNITGYNNKSGILTQAKGADNRPDAVYKLMTQIRVTGRAIPTLVIMHPNDWQAIRLLQTADGIYIWGSPSEAGPEMIWGVPVTQSDAQTENTGLVGDYSNPIYSQLLTRRGITLKITDSHASDFVSGKQMIRADIRVAFVIRRAAAFGTVTGI